MLGIKHNKLERQETAALLKTLLHFSRREPSRHSLRQRYASTCACSLLSLAAICSWCTSR